MLFKVFLKLHTHTHTNYHAYTHTNICFLFKYLHGKLSYVFTTIVFYFMLMVRHDFHKRHINRRQSLLTRGSYSNKYTHFWHGMKNEYKQNNKRNMLKLYDILVLTQWFVSKKCGCFSKMII